jgi:hypothetical protein
MPTSSGYPYPSDNWIPKDQRTTMQNPPEGLIVERAELPEHLSSEPDNTALYISKGMEHSTSMAKTRFVLPYCGGAVRSHAIVALTASAIRIDRQRSWKMLHTMAAAGDEQAVAVLKALSGFTLD